MIKTIEVGAANWADILADVKNQTEIVLTEDGEPIARIIPFENPLRGPMFGTITFHGDIAEQADEVPAFHDARMRTLEELRGSVTIHGDLVEPVGD